MWGEHLHHGYYGAEEGTKSNAQAQIDMVDNVLDWAGVQSVKKVLRGCCCCCTCRGLAVEAAWI